MNVAKWSVTRPVAVTMRIAALVLLGFICLLRLPIDLLPRVDIPIVAVNTSWPNTPPETMEAQITRPIEQAVASVPGLYSVSSSSSLGNSSVRVTLNYGVSVDQAAIDVLQAVQRGTRGFPNDPTLERPTVFKYDPSSLPILVYGVTGEKDLVKLRTVLQNDISPVLESAGGVAQVNISGGQERAILVDVDPAKLQALGIPLSTITSRIQEENNTRPGGIARRGEREYTIRAEGYLKSPAELASIPLTTRDGRIIPLSQVATVRDSALEQRVFLKQDGVPAASIGITKQADANTVETSDAVRAKVAQIQKSYPNLKFTVAYEQAGFIKGSIDELKETAIIGGVLAILVITFFLRNLRSTLVVALSIPISIISTFAIMYFGGFTLNTISLSGLALASGLIVDDAIVVLENIFRHMEGGKRRAADAAVSGTQEIMGAVVASTFTIMVVFLPLFLIKGQSGQTFTQFALVVIFSIAVSLLDATTVVPMLASRFIKEKEVAEVHHPETIKSRISFFRWAGLRLNALDHNYHRLLEKALRRRWWVLGGAVALSLVALPLVPIIGFETLPETDSGDFQVNMKLPIGTELAKTREWADYLEKNLRADPAVESVFVGAGANVSFRGAGGSLPYRGGATVRLKRDRKATTEEVIDRLKPMMAKIPGRTNASPFDMVSNILGGNSGGIEVDLFGSNIAAMQDASKTVQDALGNVPGLESVDIGIEDASPEIRFDVDRAKANALGVSFSDIANAVSTATAASQVTYYQDPSDAQQYPIYVELPVEDRRSIPDILNIPVVTVASTTAGQPDRTVLLRQVASVREATGPNEIARLNRQRYIAVSGARRAGLLGERGAGGGGEGHEVGQSAPRGAMGFRRAAETASGGVRGPRNGGVPRDRADLHLARVAVRVIHLSLDRALLGAALRARGDRRAAARGAGVRPDGVRGRAHARGDRREERHPARGLHEPASGEGDGAGRGAPHRRAASPPSHPDDLALRDPRDAAARAGDRELLEAPGAARDGGRRRVADVDRADPLRGAFGVHVLRRSRPTVPKGRPRSASGIGGRSERRGDGRRARGRALKSFRGGAFLAAPLLILPFRASAQTVPLQPNTPDVVVPPPISLPTLGGMLAPLTEEEVVRLALRLQPSIEDARGLYQTAQGRARAEASNLGPTLAVTGSLSRSDSLRGNGGTSSIRSGNSGTGTGGTGGTGTGTEGTTTTGNGSSFRTGTSGLLSSGRLALGVSQLLFDFGRTRDLVRQQRALAGAAGAILASTELDAALDARQRLADLAQNRRLVLVAQSNVENRQSQLTLAEANLASGLYPPKDVVDAKTNLANAVSALVVARANETTARILLAQAIGIDPRTPMTAASLAPPTTAPADPTDLFTLALVARPEIRQARRNLEAAGYGVSAAQKTRTPEFSANASIGTNGSTDPFQNQSTSISLGVNWPLFDSGFTQGAIQQAKGTQRSAFANYRQAQQTVVADVGQAYVNLASAVQRVAVNEVGVVNAQEGVRLAVGRYRGGVGGTFLDITNAQAQLFTAEQNLETARGDALRTRAALDRAVGSLGVRQ